MSEDSIDHRLKAARPWLATELGETSFHITPISGDASFRRYFRIHRESGLPSLVLMDAPPEKENSRPFIDVAGRLREAGIRAPGIVSFDLDQGFGIIEDFGDDLYKALINEESANSVFPGLIELLAQMATQVSAEGLPAYDEKLLRQELDLFTDWYLDIHKGRRLNHSEKDTWNRICQALIENATSQAQTFVHRDFHSCNLLHNPGLPPAVIDFQDAVHGPVTYDLASLVWDRYIHWPREQLECWMEDLRIRIQPDIDPQTWIRHCDLMGLQRNLKVVGIFARLHYRDHKQGYLDMIPMFYRYLQDVLPAYPEFSEFNSLLKDPSCAP